MKKYSNLLSSNTCPAIKNQIAQRTLCFQLFILTKHCLFLISHEECNFDVIFNQSSVKTREILRKKQHFCSLFPKYASGGSGLTKGFWRFPNGLVYLDIKAL